MSQSIEEKEVQSSALDNSDGVIISKNPLEVIGWTYSILALKLSNDQLYKLAVHSARLLAAAKHQDSGHSKEVSQHFNQAFTALKDRAQFDKAMQDFRQEYNYQLRLESQQVSLLKLENASLASQVEKLEKAAKYRGYGVEQLAKANSNLSKFALANGIQVYNRSYNGEVYASSLSLVKSLDLLTIRFSGNSKPLSYISKHEKAFLIKDFTSLIRSQVSDLLEQKMDHLEWGAFIKFIERYTIPTRYIVLGIKTVKVNKGLITNSIAGIKKAAILGSVSGADLGPSKLRTTTTSMVNMSGISFGLSPYLIRSNFLVVDRKPRITHRNDLTPRTQTIAIEDTMERKLAACEYDSTKAHSVTDLALIGLIIGINKS